MRKFSRQKFDTLIAKIKEHILPGTIIISDFWKAYSRLKESVCSSDSEPHNGELVNKETGAQTNTIWSTWRAVKTDLPNNGTVKSLYDTYFVEYIFRKRYLNDAEDTFLSFLDNIKKYYSTQETKGLDLDPIPRPVKLKEPVLEENGTSGKRSALLPLTSILNFSSDDDFQLSMPFYCSIAF